jgi:hypothetical protein
MGYNFLGVRPTEGKPGIALVGKAAIGGYLNAMLQERTFHAIKFG